MSVEKQQLTSLLSRVALRDREAFEALYTLTSPRLFNLLTAMVKDEQLAADLLQEGFLKLWFDDRRYPVEHPWAWLCQSMRNLAIDELRQRRRRQGDNQSPYVLSDVQSTAMNVSSQSKDPQRLDVCLEALAYEKRNAIVLAYQHGMTHQEIVEHINSPLGTVKSWIRRGLQELKRCLTE
ncbi:sigma-70 family RNA polymerase sigma factor [Enterovibrio sp. ZSDZ42]|uniref:Sigma-70 family RNA polymerase sigma factor n=1 Tax=Enterovibrio gelatinilyticus TaxID=2899819 RepID=A0ABT5R436_9GAMM|nr:sigma-70 family RNA polymerase sigma factor [Enterovibrio sp. ZSDZ42]MDD1795038.1 sigma-70 family RNA polymerase sigma factor [Enterovibrio sp. ZSDZ42]